jgi:TolA-binding protein
MRARLTLALGALALAAVASGCAYFNTFYAARKNFELAEVQSIDPNDPLNPDPHAGSGAVTLYDKTIQGATKLLVQYPNSKWCDDGMLLIGRSLLAKGDYQGAQLKFEELAKNFPKSDLRDQATFWSGVAADRDHRRADAVALYDSVLSTYPKSKLRDETLLRRAAVYLSLKQPKDAIADLTELSGRKGALGYRASLRLADAWFAQSNYTAARGAFERVALTAPSEKLRLDALLRAGDCDEAMADYTHAADSYLQLSRTARTDEEKAQARLRYGNALALGGQVDRGLAELKFVVDDYPRTNYAAEALFRIGYLNEVVKDDLDAAAKAYDGVGQQASGSPFITQARQRRDGLAQISDSLSASRDTSAAEKAAQSAFRLAEHELFQLSRPAKAVDDYAAVERDHPQSPLAPRAALARAWVLDRRLGKADEAQAALKAILERYPGSPSAAAAKRMLDHPDSTYALELITGSALHVPMVPGRTLYVPPAPVTTQAVNPRGKAANTPAAREERRRRLAPGAPGAPGAPAAGADSSAAAPGLPPAPAIAPTPPPAPTPVVAPADTSGKGARR